MAQAVVNRLLHEPTLRLKDSAGEETSYRYVHTLRELFALETPDGEAPAAEVTPLEPRRAQRRRSS
jgi:glutamyl-tRNA reductase